jgi:hypothetical protein
MSEREIGGLDDLFGPGEERAVVEEPAPAAGPKPRSRALWVLRNLLLVAAATTVTVAALRAAGTGVSILLVVAAFVALRLLMFAVAEVAPPPVPKRGAGARRNIADDEGFYHWSGADSLRSAVRRWEQRLEWSQSDPESFSRNVLPVLAELTDERLRLRHGITRASDPRRARELLGDPLWQMLDGDHGEFAGRRPPKARDLATHVETLERL